MSEQHDEINKAAKAKLTRPDLPDPGRRRFARAGLAAPIIVTLANGRVLGQTQTPFNCTPSGWIQLERSLAPSGVTQSQACLGYSPGYWKTHPADWRGYAHGDVRFKPPEFKMQDWGAGGTSVAEAMRGGGLGSNLSMMQALWQYPGSYAFHLIAGLLNAEVIPGYMPPELVRDMYCQLGATGQYEASPGVYMTESDVVRFMNYTYHVFGKDGT